ncbi:MAG: preprotein translocase subunit YajC [Spirochaetales bacterium]|nr:preprotein translocase subunit YajC [Spirochaetales bacterium]
MSQMFSTLPLLQAGQGQDGLMGMVPTIVMMVAIFAVFYFLLIRPQRKKQKELKEMLDALKKGDKVQTIGGIRGTIVGVKEKTVVIKVDDNTKLEFARDAVQTVVKKSDEGEEETDS